MDTLNWIAAIGTLIGFGLIGLGLVVGAANARPLDTHYME